MRKNGVWAFFVSPDISPPLSFILKSREYQPTKISISLGEAKRDIAETEGKQRSIKEEEEEERKVEK